MDGPLENTNGMCQKQSFQRVRVKFEIINNILMAVMKPPDCLKWPETLQSWPG